MPNALAEFRDHYGNAHGNDESAVQHVLSDLQVSPHQTYIDFLSVADGAEGPVGSKGYLSIWSLSDLRSRNEAYHVSEFAPSLVLFGSDGADIAYAFDKRKGSSIVAVPFVGMSDSAAELIGLSLDELIKAACRSPS